MIGMVHNIITYNYISDKLDFPKKSINGWQVIVSEFDNLFKQMYVVHLQLNQNKNYYAEKTPVSHDVLYSVYKRTAYQILSSNNPFYAVILKIKMN